MEKPREIVDFYNLRGGKERIFDDMNNGFKELGSDKLKTFINIQYNSMNDAKEKLNMTASGLREHYFELQRRLYSA